jgi:hypothetical protein
MLNSSDGKAFLAVQEIIALVQKCEGQIHQQQPSTPTVLLKLWTYGPNGQEHAEGTVLRNHLNFITPDQSN